MRSFDVELAVRVRETPDGGPLTPGRERFLFRASTLAVRVELGDGAAPEDAVAELARRLERLGETPPYEGG